MLSFYSMQMYNLFSFFTEYTSCIINTKSYLIEKTRFMSKKFVILHEYFVLLVMRKLYFVLGFLMLALMVSGQVSLSTSYHIVEDQTTLMGVKIEEPLAMNSNGCFGFKLKSPVDFTSYAVGWKASTTLFSAGEFDVDVRVHHKTKGWSDILDEHGYIHPDENMRDLYFTELIFGIDQWLHDSLEFVIYPPDGVVLTEIHLVFQDMSSTTSYEGVIYESTVIENVRTCPPFPAIIPRADWCGGYSACHNPTYTPTTINPTHIVVHHGGGSSDYTDGYAVVRSYWNYHVNSLGWSDIGYNYLFDKYGNFFQGRHNLNLPTTDVRGAHAGSSNTYSIGINFLGNSDITAPTSAQLQKCAEFMAWWFDHRGFDPTSQASLLNQPGTQWLTLHRVCGHRDVNATACPGNALYALLPSLRADAKQIIDDCSGPTDTIPPSTTISVNRKWQSTDFEAVFTDEDNPGGSGVKHSFVQVMDYDGTEWRANASLGFFNDNFTTAIHSDWTNLSGTWNIDTGHLLQSDESITNPNIYALVSQTSGNIYMYHWQMRISGSGSNRRAGIFFFCSDPAALYRGESYMIYFRAETNNIEIYKASGGTISGILHQATSQIDASVWYDIKVVYNPSTGLMNVYQDNKHVLQWQDATPLTSGSGISFRSGGCRAEYDDMKVYKNRSSSLVVEVGNLSSKMARYESPNSSQDACRIRTQIVDNNHNWSNSVAEMVFIDWTSPLTSSSVANTWQTDDFLVDFTDTDNLSGIEKRFYQVLDFDGTRWSANAEEGFFCDVMDNSNPDWTVYSGTWTFNGTELVQSDEGLNNTNIYTYLKQDLSNRYLYEFNMNIDGIGSNRRAGFHYFCDTPDTTNRGNSYFIWFRIATQKLEFYKVVNDTFNLEKFYPVTFTAGQWYNVKVIFDRITGEHFVYLDNVLVGEWKEPSPFPLATHANHQWISFRSGHSVLKVNQLKVYRTRYPQVTVTLGDSTKMIRYQNPDPYTHAAKVKSVVSDSAQNISAIYFHDLNVDWTPPSMVGYVYDGISVDIDTSHVTTQIDANWDAAIDPHSDIIAYWYAIGTSPGANDVAGWINNGLSTNLTHTGLSLIEGQTYYVSIKAQNGAELLGDSLSSDGVLIVLTVSIPEQGKKPGIELFPNPATDELYVILNLFELLEGSLSMYDMNGKIIWQKQLSLSEGQHQVEIPIAALNPAKGIYNIQLIYNDVSMIRQLILK